MKKIESIYNERTLGWVAGIIDGEGSIMFMSNHSKNEYASPQVQVTNTTVEIIQTLFKLFGGRIIKKPSRKKHHSQAYDWRLSYSQALNFMKLILPYLVHPLKKSRAKLLVEKFPKVVRKNGKYNSKQLRARKQLEKDFYSLS